MLKLSQLKYKYNYLKQNEVFTVRAMWDMVKYFEKNPTEIYWDYRDQLSSDDLDLIREKGFEGLCELEENINDLNFDHMYDLQMEQLSENIPSDPSDYKLSYLKNALRAFREEMDDELLRVDDLLNLTFGEQKDLDCGFDDAMTYCKIIKPVA